jgi:dihydroneopterin aldolase
MPDQIHIQALKVMTRLGVPDEERATPQQVSVFLTLEPNTNFTALGDSIEQTIDYATVCEAIERVAGERPRRLLETLAEEIAQQLLGRFPIWKLRLEVRKFILPQTDYVAVQIERPL